MTSVHRRGGVVVGVAGGRSVPATRVPGRSGLSEAVERVRRFRPFSGRVLSRTSRPGSSGSQVLLAAEMFGRGFEPEQDGRPRSTRPLRLAGFKFGSISSTPTRGSRNSPLEQWRRQKCSVGDLNPGHRLSSCVGRSFRSRKAEMIGRTTPTERIRTWLGRRHKSVFSSFTPAVRVRARTRSRFVPPSNGTTDRGERGSRGREREILVRLQLGRTV